METLVNSNSTSLLRQSLPKIPLTAIWVSSPASVWEETDLCIARRKTADSLERTLQVEKMRFTILRRVIKIWRRDFDPNLKTVSFWALKREWGRIKKRKSSKKKAQGNPPGTLKLIFLNPWKSYLFSFIIKSPRKSRKCSLPSCPSLKRWSQALPLKQPLTT